MTACPCCGQSVDKLDPKAIVAGLEVSDTERRILICLANHFGIWIRRERVADFIYLADPNGGPLDASNVVSVTISRIKRKKVLEPCGLELRGKQGATSGICLTWKDDTR